MKGRMRRMASLWRLALHAPVGYRRLRYTGIHRRVPFVGWLYYLLCSHGTPRLLAYGVVGVVPTLVLLFFGVDSPFFMLGFAVLAYTLAGMAVGLAIRPRLHVICHGPVRMEAGSKAPVRYEVRNVGRLASRDISIDTLIYPDPRHLRLSTARIPTLAAGGVCTAEGRIIGRKRGSYVLPALRYDSSHPFGVWRWGRTSGVPRTVIIYPRYARLVSFDIPLGVRNRLDAADSRQLAREALEFHGCREFRDGDALRHVHPRSSARLGIPVVKEYQAEGRSRTAVLVDTAATPLATLWHTRGVDLVEGTLSLAAALTDALARTDRVLELLVAGPGIYRFVSAGRAGYLEDVLDILAALEPCQEDPVARLAPVLLDEICAIQSVCLLLTRWDAKRKALVDQLEAFGVGLRVVLVTPRRRRPDGLPGDVVCHAVQDVLDGKVVTL